jgi:hypothetical protein
MEEVKNLTQDDVLELIKDFPITPLRNKVIISMNVEEVDENEVELSGAAFSPRQFVLAVGTYTKDYLQPGQLVNLDLDAMTVRVPSETDSYQPVHRIQIKPVQVKDRMFGLITEDKIEYLVNE